MDETYVSSGIIYYVFFSVLSTIVSVLEMHGDDPSVTPLLADALDELGSAYLHAGDSTQSEVCDCETN